MNCGGIKSSSVPIKYINIVNKTYRENTHNVYLYKKKKKKGVSTVIPVKKF